MSSLICPRCQQANLCLAGTPQVAQCWCMQVKFPAELLSQTTPSQCICQQCLQQELTQLPATKPATQNTAEQFSPQQQATE